MTDDSWPILWADKIIQLCRSSDIPLTLRLSILCCTQLDNVLRVCGVLKEFLCRSGGMVLPWCGACYLRRLKSFKASLFKLFKQEHKHSLTMDQLRQQVDADHTGVEFSDAELWAALDQMQEDNQIMVSDNVIFLI